MRLSSFYGENGKGSGSVSFIGKTILLHNIACSAGENLAFSLSGRYDFENNEIQSDFTHVNYHGFDLKLQEKEHFRVTWKGNGGKWHMHAVEGNFSHLQGSLVSQGEKQEKLVLEGQIHFSPQIAHRLFPAIGKELVAKYEFKGDYQLDGQWLIDPNSPFNVYYMGKIVGHGCQVKGLECASLDGALILLPEEKGESPSFFPKTIQLCDVSLKDSAGRSISRMLP